MARRSEVEVLAGLARLATIEQEYADTVRAALDLLEDALDVPLLCLSLLEHGEVAHYARARGNVATSWAQDAAGTIAQVHEGWLQRIPGRSERAPEDWFVSYPVWLRSGRPGLLALASTGPLTIDGQTGDRAHRLAESTLLILDHALLLQQIEQLDPLDALTGVINHRRLLDVLDYELRRHRFSSTPLSLLLLDIDGLRAINRAYGRSYGNHILKRLAALIRETVRPIDVVARCGVDEFAVLLPETDEDGAQHALETLRDRLLTMEFAGGQVRLNGIAIHSVPDEGTTPDGLLRRAEQVLHAAKRQQQSRVGLLPVRS